MAEKKKENIEVAANMQMNGAGLVLRSANELKLTAELFFKGGILPATLNTMAKVACVIEAGLELGFKPWQSIQNLHIVNGQIGIKSTAIGGLIRSSGKAKCLKQYYKGEEGTDDYRAIVQSQRTDDETVHDTEFSIADAKTAGLWGKDNWTHYPKDMLMWRALSRHGRAYYGDVLSGFYSVDELAEIRPPTEALGPEVPSREERKQVDAVVKDTAEITKEKLSECYMDFVKNAEEDLGVSFELLGLTDKEIWPVFGKFAEAILKLEDFNYEDATNYTLEYATTILGCLVLDGIPTDIVKLIPVPAEKGAAE